MLYFATAVVMAYLIPVSIPSYIQINNAVHPVMGWALGLLSAYLGALVAYAAVFVPSAVRLRERAASEGAPEQAARAVA
jgi:hypothetical protein